MGNPCGRTNATTTLTHSRFILVVSWIGDRLIKAFVPVCRDWRRAAATFNLGFLVEAVDVKEHVIDKEKLVLGGPANVVWNDGVSCDTPATIVFSVVMEVVMERVLVLGWHVAVGKRATVWGKSVHLTI